MSNLGKAIVLLLIVAYVSPSRGLSIQREPVPVTNRNSGPRYDIDEVEKTKLTDQGTGGASNGNAGNNNNNQDGRPEDSTQPESSASVVPIGRMSIRRIFLVPVMNPWNGAGHEQDQETSGQAMQAPQQHHHRQNYQPDSSEAEHPFLSRPFWPFLTPIRAPQMEPHRHLFGSDEASRSPSGEREGSADSMVSSGSSNKENEDEPPTQAAARPIFDPMQMMIDMIHQAMNGQLEHHQQEPPQATPNFHDLANEANSISRPGLDRLQPEGGEPAKPDMATAMRPFRAPTSQNETKRDIVEIDGKKYLRKTEINRHVGENIVFMTKRLIFIPLNETETMTTTTMTPSTVSNPSDAKPDNEDTEGRAQELPHRPTGEPALTETMTTKTTTTTNTTPTTTVAPASDLSTLSTIVTNDDKPDEPIGGSSTPASTTTTPTGSPAAEEMTTKADGSAWAERVSKAIEKVAERIVENAEAKLNSATTTTTTTTTTPSPSAN